MYVTKGRNEIKLLCDTKIKLNEKKNVCYIKKRALIIITALKLSKTSPINAN